MKRKGRIESDEKLFCGVREMRLVPVAADGDVQRLGKIEREHLHKALGVDGALAIHYLHCVGLQRGKTDEFLYVAQRRKMYLHADLRRKGLYFCRGNCYNRVVRIIPSATTGLQYVFYQIFGSDPDRFLGIIMKFHCYTLGCKVNQYETQAMERQLAALGHEEAPEADSDVLIVNTCTVTSVADRKNRTLIHRLRREHPQAILGVCGCYAQVSTDEVRAMGADVISGSGGRQEFVQLLLQAYRERRLLVSVDQALRRREFELLPAGGLAARTRAMLKVQDGCSNFCTYCIIPYARGPVRSLPLEAAVEQTRALAAAGYREIVVTGIEIASWGRERKDGSRFADLAEAICRAAPQARIRLGSLEPRIIDEDFCRRLSQFDNFCPQFHLSLQSGSDTVLARMHRKYDTARYLESVDLLKQYFPGCAVTTDLIVGFPGETEQEFEESLAFAEACGFSAMHIFPYSRRAGTPADAMPDQIPKAVKSARAARASEVAASLRERYDAALIGTAQEVLFEQTEDGFFTGHAMNYVKVYARGEGLHNTIRSVRITALRSDGVEGELI